MNNRIDSGHCYHSSLWFHSCIVICYEGRPASTKHHYPFTFTASWMIHAKHLFICYSIQDLFPSTLLHNFLFFHLHFICQNFPPIFLQFVKTFVYSSFSNFEFQNLVWLWRGGHTRAASVIVSHPYKSLKWVLTVLLLVMCSAVSCKAAAVQK